MTIKATTNAHQVGVYVRERAGRINWELNRAMEATANQMIRRARKLSSGTVSYEMMRRMGHPYRKGGPNPLNPAIINAHRGKFRAGWKKRVFTSAARTGGEGVTIKLWNDADAAKYMRGTKRMVHRPIIRQIIKDTMPAHREEIRRAMRRAIVESTVGRSIGRGASGVRGGFLSGARRAYQETQGL